MSASELSDRAAALSHAERALLVSFLTEDHPVIARRLLARIDAVRERDRVREQMGPHPFTRHPALPEAQLCYLESGPATCLRSSKDPLHVPAAER